MTNIRSKDKPIEDSPVYSKILFTIADDHVSASNKTFLKEVNKSREILVMQLRLLEKQGYVVRDTNHPKKEKRNQVFYSVNFATVLNNYFAYLKKLEEQFTSLKVDLGGKPFKFKLKDAIKEITKDEKTKALMEGVFANLFKKFKENSDRPHLTLNYCFKVMTDYFAGFDELPVEFRTLCTVYRGDPLSMYLTKGMIKS